VFSLKESLGVGDNHVNKRDLVEKGDYLEELPEEVDSWHYDRGLCGMTE